MKTVTIGAAAIAGIALLAGLGGCNRASDAQAPKTIHEAEFVSPGKAMAAVSMTHQFSAKPAIGERLMLELVFAADRNDSINDTISLEIHADDALAVRPQIGRSINSGETVVVDLLPQAEGRYYVNVIARLGTGSHTKARVFSVPVQVGKGGYVSTSQKATIGPDGERLIRMQAQEKPD